MKDLKDTFKKKVMKYARKAPPLKSPEWCFGIAGLIVGAGIAIFPMAFERMNHLPLLNEMVRGIPHWKYISSFGGYFCAFLFSWLAVPPICRGIQVCYPDEFEAFEHERELQQ